ncbi:single hybrid motif-containing protein [Irpex rosettiformis]|uniref:Single hybrid motif-containing protein n=1 Tax=Irpex rosettiformis TaxID=378272 RepID=A0ACB8TPQ2_9APHY|nr:single hybrid motif-containing protein [Irpex rosettiformis]
MHALRLHQNVARAIGGRRLFQTSASRRVVTKFTMPAMSPTMTEGGISSWKKKEGEVFTSGDVLLEIETDKATIDVEAQDDGILGKILVPDGSKGIPIGKPIALIAEEGDDISNLEVPKDDVDTPKSSPPPAPVTEQAPPSGVPDKTTITSSGPSSKPHELPSSSRPLFPSVLRILEENGISDTSKIEGTGVRGMITKGDVLTYLGKASGPLGTFKAALEKEEEQAKKEKSGVKAAPPPPPPLDGPALRRLIASNLAKVSQKPYNPVCAILAPAPTPTFDDIIADYLPPPSATHADSPAPEEPKTSKSHGFEGLL